MPDSIYPKSTPQFTTAEYAGSPGGDRCAACSQPLTARYYRVNGKMACEGCTEQVRRRLPKDSHSAYVRGLIFGIGAAIVGMAFYAGFTIVTHFYIGYISLAVGWLIGKAMMKGSNGIGGRRYQITAVLLTYAAVSMAAIPIAIAERPRDTSPAMHSSQQQPSADGQTSPDGDNAESTAKPKISFGAALLTLTLIGLASPFLELQDPFHGLIGLVILFVGIRIAWKLTQGGARADIQGPFDNATAAQAMR